MKSTKGPWKIRPTLNHYTELIADVGEDKPLILARVPKRRNRTKEFRQNMLLMSKAPEMKEAMEAFVRQIEYQYRQGHVSQPLLSLRDIYRKILTEIEGKESDEKSG